MTIITTHWRRAAAGLMASIAVVLALAWAAADAPASSQNRGIPSVVDQGAGMPMDANQAAWAKAGMRIGLADAWAGRCDIGYVCLYQDSDGHGRKIHFNRPGTYKLKNFSMGPGKRGVSSFWNRRFGHKAQLGLPNFRFTLRSHANVRPSLNDQATIVVLSR